MKRWLALALLLLCACATKQSLPVQAAAADALATTISAAGVAIENAAESAERWALQSGKPPIEIAANIGSSRAKFASIERAYEAVRQAHVVYVHGLRMAAIYESPSDPALLRQLLTAWKELARLAETLDVRLPNLPPELTALVKP